MTHARRCRRLSAEVRPTLSHRAGRVRSRGCESHDRVASQPRSRWGARAAWRIDPEVGRTRGTAAPRACDRRRGVPAGARGDSCARTAAPPRRTGDTPRSRALQPLRGEDLAACRRRAVAARGRKGRGEIQVQAACPHRTQRAVERYAMVRDTLIVQARAASSQRRRSASTPETCDAAGAWRPVAEHGVPWWAALRAASLVTVGCAVLAARVASWGRGALWIRDRGSK